MAARRLGHSSAAVEAIWATMAPRDKAAVPQTWDIGDTHGARGWPRLQSSTQDRAEAAELP
jgi:hypothetical protein